MVIQHKCDITAAIYVPITGASTDTGISCLFCFFSVDFPGSLLYAAFTHFSTSDPI